VSGLEGVLPSLILRALEEEARRRGSTPEAVLVGMLSRLLPEERRWEAFLEAARAALQHASRLASAGAYREAFRRLWGCVLLAVAAEALRRGIGEPGSLDEYWEAVDRLGGSAYTAWYAGLAAFVAGEKGVESRGHLEAMRKIIEGYVSGIGEGGEE